MENASTALMAFNKLQQRRSTLSVSYFIKNYLLLMNSIQACLGPQKKRFRKMAALKPTFALGYYEDLYSGKIYYLEGTRGSTYITSIELEKEDTRYNLNDILVRKEKAKRLEAAPFLAWLGKTVQELALNATE